MKRVKKRKRGRPIFSDPKLNKRVLELERNAQDGEDKSWVHQLQLAWIRHYQGTGKRSKRIAGRPKDRQFLQQYRSLLDA